MTDWQPRRLREKALIDTETRLAGDPDSVPLRFERACLLSELGRAEAAKEAYIAILRLQPDHAGTLNNLGSLLYATGYRSAARTTFAEAAARHPDDPMGHVNLANLLLEEADYPRARQHYEAALRLVPDHAQAHRGMACLLTDLGREDEAARHLESGFRLQPIVPVPYRGEAPPIPILLLIAAVGGNLRLGSFFDDRVYLVSIAVAEFVDPRAPLPPHRLIVNAIGDADRSLRALEAAEAIVARSPMPVINHPSRVKPTGRAANALRLQEVKDAVVPLTRLVPRERLTQAGAADWLSKEGLRFPLLLRSPGFHTGQHFLKLDRAEDLAVNLGVLPGRELMAIQYLDARGGDGKSRKYRVMIVDGRLYPLHLAVSERWMVHYFSAEMGTADYRAEERAFLENMEAVIGAKAIAALEQIGRILGLDYAGVDFGLDGEGRLLLFEANAAMVILPAGADERFAYRRDAVGRVSEAVNRLLAARIAPAARPAL
jgi:hypothetical protein